MTHRNDYAWAILPREIVFRLGCREDDTDAIELERSKFDGYCKDLDARGIVCISQLEAWQDYNETYPVIGRKSKMVLPNVPLNRPHGWQAEVKEILDRQVSENPGNYDENGGQQ